MNYGVLPLVKTSHNKDFVGIALNRLEKLIGPSILFDKTVAIGITAFGQKEELKYKYFGDFIQPKTILQYKVRPYYLMRSFIPNPSINSAAFESKIKTTMRTRYMQSASTIK